MRSPLPRAQVREDYASVADFIKISVFEAAVHIIGARSASSLVEQRVVQRHASTPRMQRRAAALPADQLRSRPHDPVRPPLPLADGKKQAVDSEHASADRVIWRRNDFPYNFEPSMEHWLLWASRELPQARVDELIAERFPPGEWDVLEFVNPVQLKSVLSVWHCHVIVRPKPEPAA